MYNSKIAVNYTNNEEYRKCLRNMFQMKNQSLDETLDPETADEQDYDDDNASVMLDYVFSITQYDTLFKELYVYGAGTMLSLDQDIGLAVLFSYDYFILFHPCLQQIINNPQSWNSSNPAFIALKQKLTK